MNDIGDNTIFALVRMMLFLFYFMSGIRQIINNKGKKHYLYILGCILIVWSLELLRDALVLFCPSLSTKYMCDLFKLIDLIVVPLCVVYTKSMINTHWLTTKRLIIHASPFVLFIIAYAVTKNMTVFVASVAIFVIYTAICVYRIVLDVRQYEKDLENEYSQIEDISIKWLKTVVALFLGNVIFCVILYIFPSHTSYYFYYSYCVAMWLYIIYKSDLQQYLLVDTKEMDEAAEIVANNKEYKTGLNQKGKEKLQELFEDKRIFLNPNISLSDVAKEIGTNRSYISDYLNKEKGSSFHDYVNNYRIEYAANLLRTEEYNKIIDVSISAGFNSFVTFLRAFKKRYGVTPSEYKSLKK